MKNAGSGRLLTRRATLIGGTALVGAAALPVRAADKQVVVGTWGGDYANLLGKNIDTPFVVPKGIEVLQDIASDEPRRNKMVAEA